MEFEPFSIQHIALAFFLICLLLSVYFREKARGMEAVTGKRIRSYYRHDWISNMVKNNDINYLLETVRNNILVSSGMITALVIASGFVINSGTGSALDGSITADARVLLIIGLLAYSFFMILLEARTLMYIPVIFGTSEALIKKHENMGKVDYLAKLLHESFDHMSNAIRALFFIVTLLVWFYNVYIFMAFTLVISYLMVREDFGKRSEIMLF